MAKKQAKPPGSTSKDDGGSFQINGDLTQPQITTVKFDGKNYLSWSKSVLIYLQGKDMEGYLTSEVEVPEKSDPQYWKSKTKNATVMGWLLSSINPEISEHFLFLETTHQI